MATSTWMDPSSASSRDVLVAGALVVALAVLTLPFRTFVLDDAYITYRYAEHLADGHGIVWNIGEDPVEGSSSFLWVLVTAVPHLAGVDAPTFAQAASWLAGAATVVVTYLYVRHRRVPRPIAVAATAPMAVSPAFAFTAVEGMETTLAGAFILVASISAIHVSRSNRRWAWTGLGLALLFAMLTRPDAGAFAVPLLGVLAWVLHRRGDVPALRRGLAWVGGTLVLPGAAYFAWRWNYFGYPLPNTFYVKQGGTLGAFVASGENIFTFVTAFLGLLLVAAAIAWALDPEGVHRRLDGAGPVLVGLAGLGVAGVLFAPIQGFLWRFQMPALGGICLVAALAIGPAFAARARPGREISGVRFRAIAQIALVGLLILAPLHTFRTAADAQSDRHQHDRVLAGQALAPFADEGYRLFVTESGAVPYYSGWTTVDWHGLNNETIAHGGLSAEFLQAYDPTVVMSLTPPDPAAAVASRPLLFTFLEEGGYQLAAVVQKAPGTGTHHAYFVDPEAPDAPAITCALRSLKSVETMDPTLFLGLTGLDVEPARPAPDACSTTSPS